jgi:uncharacterized protein (TIGR04222 family)
MTNPLDLRGPEFLRFYVVYGLGVFLLAWLARLVWRWADQVPPGARWGPGIYPVEGDAYTLALLRGGPREVALTVLGRLMVEGFFVLEKDALREPRSPSSNRSRLSPLEEGALAVITSAASGKSGLAPPEALSRVEKALEPQLSGARADLEMAGLAPGADQRRGYRMIGLGALLLVPGLGAAKLLVAWMRGRGNVGFLIALLIVSLVVSFKLMKPPSQTVAGKRYLKWLRESHQGLVKMVSAGRRQSFGELALVAGIFGLGALPTLAPLQKAMIPPPTSSDGGSGCSSCSSSSGCGGGGGCGGGCGGCGG